MNPQIGMRIHGFADGYFGRDSYSCRTIEAVGSDWIVTRSDSGVVEIISHQDFQSIDNIDDRFHCGEEC